MGTTLLFDCLLFSLYVPNPGRDVHQWLFPRSTRHHPFTTEKKVNGRRGLLVSVGDRKSLKSPLQVSYSGPPQRDRHDEVPWSGGGPYVSTTSDTDQTSPPETGDPRRGPRPESRPGSHRTRPGGRAGGSLPWTGVVGVRVVQVEVEGTGGQGYTRTTGRSSPTEMGGASLSRKSIGDLT